MDLGTETISERKRKRDEKGLEEAVMQIVSTDQRPETTEVVTYKREGTPECRRRP